jgi:type IV pilus assembly protein PilQ
MVSWTKNALALMGASLVMLAGAGSSPAQPEAMPQACLERLPSERISLNLRDANVQTTLRLLAQQYKVNMLVTDEVTQRVTLDFFQVPAREVFRAIIESTNLRCVEAGSVLRVSTAARLKAEDDERARLVENRMRLDAETRKRIVEAQRDEADFEATKARGPIKEVTIRLSYADAEEVAKTLQGILGLPPEGLVPAGAPIPGIYAPPAPTVIGAQPPPPTTAPAPVPAAPPDSLGKGLTIKAHKPTNSIFIRFYANDLDRIVKLVREQLDFQQPQVQIAAQMVITSRSALEQIGVQWGGAFAGSPTPGKSPAVVGSGFTTGPPLDGTAVVPPSGGLGNNPNFTGSNLLPISPTTGFPSGGNLVNLPVSSLITAANPALGLLFGIVGRDFNINLAIQALETSGKAKQIAAPNVVTVENSEAIISRGFEVPFVSQSGFGGTNVQFKDALLELRVTPNVIREEGVNKIRMKMELNNNEPDFSRTVLGNPPLFKRRGKTEVVLREGERVVIGGITNENAVNQVRQVPLLGSIPVLGWLFKSREISGDVNDLIIIVTPTVVAQAGTAARR